ncbi:MAG TPA: hypothetical protein GXX48_18950 [Ochrobactrum intermedium]|uniref:Uncharacterized protein n=1 Tax=Brucella intermedia TaxID=94625 RepID=A0A7V6PEV7_9HYPH|nr:hypothetical protein [Brucella intermedia]HHV69691.1 hypothetical protein [Brucella intermedia]
MHIIELSGPSTASTTYDGQVITETRQKKSSIPVICRKLIAMGADPDAPLVIRRDGKQVFKPSKLSKWAEIDIVESDKRGLMTVKYRPFYQD